MNKLYFGDNLEILREMDEGRVDLICTDPPFNSGRDYNSFIGDSSESEVESAFWRAADGAFEVISGGEYVLFIGL